MSPLTLNQKRLAGAVVLVVAIACLPMLGRALRHSSERHAAARAAKMAAGSALAQLDTGNARFAAGAPTNPHEDQARRAEVAQEQKPVAIVLSCSDSRVPPEEVFDQGVGDLFVVRTAGEVLDKAAIGTLEYGVEHLHVPLLVVLGHSRCGAVTAACDAVEKRERAPGQIGFLIDAIKPAVKAAHGEGPERVTNAIAENVRRVVDRLSDTGPILEEREDAGTLVIRGGVYDLDSGKVKWIEQ